jgi:hypothetical protein
MGDQTIDTYLAFLLFHGPGFVGFLTSAKVLGAGEGVDGVDFVGVVRCRFVGCRAGDVVDVLPLLHMSVGFISLLHMQRTYTYAVGVGYI